MYLPLFPFTRAMSQRPCLHEVLTTATIMSKFCEEYVISLSRYCGKTLRQMNMGFFKARYVRDYVAAAKLKAAVIWAAEIAAVLILGIVLAVGYGKITVMQEGSMDPTLNAGDVLLVDRMAYRFSTPKRGDIIVYKTGDDKKASTHIKRIIGLPGETIQIKDGQILIDGETYQEDGEFPGIENAGVAETKVALDSGEYFVLGDNRNNSEDSRYADMGNVKKRNIIGKVWFIASPWSRFGFV
jgi:signal peptidase I